MTPVRLGIAVPVVLLFVAVSAGAQGSTIPSSQATAFMGTWLFTMTEPVAFKGSQQIVRVSDKNGTVAATIQIGKFPVMEATGVFKDGDMLVLTISHQAKPPMMENGAPIWAVISLVPDGSTMKTAQMLERSQTIKRGTGQKQSQ